MGDPTDHRETDKPATLVECLACGRAVTLPDREGAFGSVPLVQLTRRLRCSACGSRAVRAERPGTPRDLARRMRARIRQGRPAPA